MRTAAGVMAAVAAAVALVVAAPPASAALPETPDHHALLVDPADARTLLLGTHDGVFRSADGGRTWKLLGLRGQDAMILARAGGRTVWAAGHMVLARSADGGATWRDVRPRGLPGLDIHAFAVHPRAPGMLYAAVAGQGLYRSTDGGRRFVRASARVGGAVMALAVLPDGRLLAADMEEGLLESRDRGVTWRQLLRAQLMGLAVHPRDARRVLATTRGIALSTDGGARWRLVLELEQGAGPVAWSASAPRTAYVVGFDRRLYRSTDGGQSWQPVDGR
jgi:photosystem II stability/assembly factor-like uncharacterized protein